MVMMSRILRKLKRQEEASEYETSFMIRNGGILLERLIASSKGKYNPIRSFSAKEVERATNDYDSMNLVTKFSFGSYRVYKGFLNERPVSVMVFVDNMERTQEYCYNNIVFAAQMCHNYGLRLIGCCLETETPVVVFESMKYGSLADCIGCNGEYGFEPLCWTRRLKIAMEIANVVAYFHVGFARPVLVRVVTPSYVLFSEDGVAKLFDFSLCVSIPEGETCVKDDEIVGSFGYLAPEYALSGFCDEKCDVFSFGILLLVLLTGQEAIDRGSSSAAEEGYLRDRVLKHIESNSFKELVDPIIVGEGLSPEKERQLHSFADLAMRSSSEEPSNRPTMVDVAKEIRKLYLSCCSC